MTNSVEPVRFLGTPSANAQGKDLASSSDVPGAGARPNTCTDDCAHPIGLGC